jgi:hypothetical protein
MMSGTMNGLLTGAPTALATPPALPQIPGLEPRDMMPLGFDLGSEEMLAFLLPALLDPDRPPDSDANLPPQLHRYAAGLRPTPRPSGAAWQQEIIYDRLQKTDAEIAETARYYFRIAQNYDMYLSRERITASQYYAGRPLGDEEKGRSQLVLTTVRDTIRATLPSLLRIFTAVENPVEFTPVSSDNPANAAQATALARQATDYARWALFTANKGWQILHDVLLDALTRKAGWVRWYWGKRKAVRTEVCEGLLMPQLAILLAQPGVKAHRIVRRPMLQEEAKAIVQTPEGAMYLQQGGAPEIWSANITRSAAQSWPLIEAVPAEMVWVVADANTVEGARGIFHVRDVPASDLIEQGLPEDKVMAHCDTLMRPQQRREQIARDYATGYNIKPGAPNDRSMGICRYAEGWIKSDTDGDNRAELIHVHMLGNATTLVQWERTDEVPLSCFTPYREPSRIIGNSQADMVMDLQRTQTRVMRSVLDSLGQSIFPRTVATVGQANMADVRQTAIGSIIRVSQQGAVQELAKPFLGGQALTIMDALEAVRESRTGITRASQGLTAEQLQSTAPIAVAAQTSAAQDRLDMVARTLAETGLAPLYAGLLRMMARQQDRPNVILLRGAWITIDPRALATMWEMSINIGGKGTPIERLTMLAQIAQKQEQIMAQGGLNNPLVGLPQYRNTLARMCELAAISDAGSYFKELPPGWAPPPDPPPQPSTDQILAQVEGQKTMASMANDRAKQQTDRADKLLTDDRERDKAALDAWVKTYAVAAQYGTPLPGVHEFRQAMASSVPLIAPLANLPPMPQIPNPTANPGNPSPGFPAGRPPAPPVGAPPAAPLTGPPRPPRMPGAIPPPGAPAGGATDPATALAMRQAMVGRGMPNAMSMLQNRAGLAAPMPPGAAGASPNGG